MSLFVCLLVGLCEKFSNDLRETLFQYCHGKKRLNFGIDVIQNGPLPSTGQHLSYGDCLEIKREYYQNCSMLDCVTQCSQSAAHLCEQFLQIQMIGFVTLVPLRCA